MMRDILELIVNIFLLILRLAMIGATVALLSAIAYDFGMKNGYETGFMAGQAEGWRRGAEYGLEHAQGRP